MTQQPTASALASRSPQLSSSPPFKPHLATLVMFGTVALSGGIVAAWFAGEGRISRIFATLQR
ncbi:MAG: hypothetical protein AAFY15_11130, partial [Cyanobacteria bacterium J06648_11]